MWSSFLIAEFAHVFTRNAERNARRRGQLPGDYGATLNRWVEQFSQVSVFVNYTPLNWENLTDVRDRDDRPVLATAIQGKAQYIVSFDKKHYPAQNPYSSPLPPYQSINYLDEREFINEVLRLHAGTSR